MGSPEPVGTAVRDVGSRRPPWPGKGQMNKSDIQVRVLKQSEGWGSLTGSPRKKGKLLPGKKEHFAVSM